MGAVDDNRVAGGTMGLAIQLYHAGDQAVFEFDNFEWRAPKGAVSSVTPTPTPKK